MAANIVTRLDGLTCSVGMTHHDVTKKYKGMVQIQAQMLSGGKGVARLGKRKQQTKEAI